jgi:hypothetical protein
MATSKLGTLSKINNNAKFNMVEKGNKKFYWCDEHQYPGSNVKGMYVFHKPTEHDAWKARKDELNKRRGKKSGSKDTKKALLQRLCLLLLLLLHLQAHPSYPLQSHFKRLSQLLLDSVKISSIKFGKIVAMPWETKWPQLQD